MSELTTPDELTTDSTIEEVGEAAYYAACISDSTYHGTDFTRATNVCVQWAKQFDRNIVSRFEKSYDKFEEIRESKKA
jgi:hypothetical protein